MTHPAHSRWRSQTLVVVIALISIIPFGLAWYYAQHPELIEKTSNYGALIPPGQQLDPAQLVAESTDAAATLEQVKGRWLLLQAVPGSCAEECAETLHKTHQGWLMLNKEMLRVKRLLLMPAAAQASKAPAVAQDDALLTAGLTPVVLQALTRAIGKAPGAGMVILLDPMGNLVLWYDTGFDPYQMVKDLKHLLKASQIG